jgi:hypothetical protein
MPTKSLCGLGVGRYVLLISLISIGSDAATVDECHGLTTMRVRIRVCVIE